MLRKPIRPRHGTVVAYLALFVALGGTSYAAVTLSKNDVRSKHIKDGQVKKRDIGRNAVTSIKVQDGKLRAKGVPGARDGRGRSTQPASHFLSRRSPPSRPRARCGAFALMCHI